MKTETKQIKRRYVNSSSFAMAVLFTVFCGCAALSFGYFIHYFTKGHLIQSTDAVLESEIRYIMAAGVDDYETQDVARLHLVLSDTTALPAGITPDVGRLTEGIIVFDYPPRNRRYAAKIYTMADQQRILVGTDITDIAKDFRFMQWLGFASILFVMLVVFISYVISVFVVSGTNKIADTARHIMNTGDLSQRVDIGSRWDDLGNMSAVLNMLLDRIQELMHGVRQVSDNIAHDLRTPLTRLRATMDSLEDGAQKDHLLAEADQLLATFNAILRISRIEAEKQRVQFKTINLHDLLEDVVSFYEPLSEDKNITLDTALEEIAYHGDRDLLFQAFANILDNAIKFTPDQGEIAIRLSREAQNIHVTITDNGIGVPEADKEKIFHRFYRTEKSRTTTGTGLGLSMVHAVVSLHHGRVYAENTPQGLAVITIL